MIKWLLENISTIIISGMVLTMVSAITYKLIKDKKSGKHSCGCDCGNCSMSCSEHKKYLRQ